MRVLYFHQYFNTPEMNGSTRSYEIARRLVARGHEVHIVTSDRQRGASGKWRTSTCGGATIHWVSVPYSNDLPFKNRIRAFLKFAYAAGRRGRSIDADLVFATSTPLTIALPAVYAKKRQKIPMIMEIRDLWPEVPIAMGALRNPLSRRLAHWLERFAYRHAARVVALSPGMAEGVERTGYPPERITVLPNACDHDLFEVPAERGRAFRAGHPWLGDRPLAVYCGTLGLANDVGFVIRLAQAARRLDDQLRFLIIGEGREKAELVRLASGLGLLDETVFILPSIPKREMPDVLSAADVAFSTFADIPALWTNSANKVFDALASGTPVVVNHQGWIAEFIQDHEAGLVLDVADEGGSAERLVSALNDREWLSRAGLNAKKVGLERFSRDRLVEQLERLMRQVVDESGDRG